MKNTNTLSKDRLKKIVMNYAIYLILLIVVGVIVAVDPSFLQIGNLSYICTQASTRLILSLGVAGIIVLGGTDLAAGRMVGMAAVICASLLQAVESSTRVYQNMPRLPIFLPMLLAVVLCVIFCFVHGLIVAKLKVAPFIASLRIQQVVYGLFSIYFQGLANGSPIGSFDKRFTNFAQGAFHLGPVRIPYIAIYAVICTVIVWVIWNKTKIGKNMFAIGGNPEAAAVCGVNIVKGSLVIYILAGILYGFAGALEAGRTGSATNALGADYALDAIAACVVGGVSMRGGIGTIKGIVTGVIMFQIINYGLIFIGVSPYVQYAVKGSIILIAVAIDTQKYLKKK